MTCSRWRRRSSSIQDTSSRKPYRDTIDIALRPLRRVLPATIPAFEATNRSTAWSVASAGYSAQSAAQVPELHAVLALVEAGEHRALLSGLKGMTDLIAETIFGILVNLAHCLRSRPRTRRLTARREGAARVHGRQPIGRHGSRLMSDPNTAALLQSGTSSNNHRFLLY